MAERRSVRRVRERELDRTTIERLIDTAGHLPSRGNRRAYRFTVITKGETRERLSRKVVPTPVEDNVLAAYNIVLMAETRKLARLQGVER